MSQAMDMRLRSTPAGVRLCALDAIADGSARNFVLETGEGRFHGFVVRRGADAVGYVDWCPHAGLPLARRLDGYMTPDGRLIACSWHGALFDPATGISVGGPCKGARLETWPVRVRDGFIETGKEGAA